MKFFRTTAIHTEKGWDEAGAAYDKYLLEILPSLPPAWRRLADLDFHDRELIAIEKPNRSELALRIGRQKRFRTLHFIDVQHARMAKTAVGDLFVYTEVHRTDHGNGALQILLRQSELRIVAGDLGITRKCQGPD